jgi:hypothetical protein
MRDDVPATSRRDLLRSAAGALSAAVLVSPALQAQAPMRAFDSLQRGAAPSAADPIAMALTGRTSLAAIDHSVLWS